VSDAINTMIQSFDSLTIEQPESFVRLSQPHRVFHEDITTAVALLPKRLRDLLDRWQECQLSVCAIEMKYQKVIGTNLYNVTGRGSGFYVSFRDNTTTDCGFIMTNHHVIDSEAKAKDARVLFTKDDGASPLWETRLDPTNFFYTSPRHTGKRLDVTIVAFNGAATLRGKGVKPIPFFRDGKTCHDAVPDIHILVSQYPSLGAFKDDTLKEQGVDVEKIQPLLFKRANLDELYLRVHDFGTVKDTKGDWFSYNATTGGGTSGSPVLGAPFQLVGLHHTGTKEGNSGTHIKSIAEQLQADGALDKILRLA